MPLKCLIDENLRGKFTQSLIERGFAERFPVNLLEVGNPDAPPLGAQDPELLLWAQAHDCVIISLDENSLPRHLTDHLAAGYTSPGILFLRRHRAWDEILYFLVLFAAATNPEECRNRCIYVPF